MLLSRKFFNGNIDAWCNEDGLENALRCAMLTEVRRIVADSARHSSIFFFFDSEWMDIV